MTATGLTPTPGGWEAVEGSPHAVDQSATLFPPRFVLGLNAGGSGSVCSYVHEREGVANVAGGIRRAYADPIASWMAVGVCDCPAELALRLVAELPAWWTGER